VVEQGFCKAQVAGSNPVRGSRGISSVGRAPALQAGCQEFESPILHSFLLSSAVERLTVNQFVPGSIPGGGVMYRTTYREQFSYIFLCGREIVRMLIQGDDYHPGV
jgi:hypothetical protein